MDLVTYLSGGDEIVLMRRVGLALMHIAFAVVLVRSLFHFFQSGQGDFLRPLFHYLAALICLTYLPQIGVSLVRITQEVSASVFSVQHLSDLYAGRLVDDAPQTDSLSGIYALFNGRTLLRIMAYMAIHAMLIMKVVLIDIIWQVLFSVVVILGGLAIPASVIFGSSPLTSWVKMLLELMLWPVIFSLLMALMNSIIMDGAGGITVSVHLATPGSGRTNVQIGTEQDLTRICGAASIMVLTLAVPILANAIMRFERIEMAADRYSRQVVSAGRAVGPRMGWAAGQAAGLSARAVRGAVSLARRGRA